MIEIAKSNYLIIFGGFLGFCAAAIVGLYVGNDWVTVVRNAMIGAVAGGISMKFFLGVLRANINALIRQKMQEQADNSDNPKQNNK